MHPSAPPVIPDSHSGFLKMSKASFHRAASAPPCLLPGLCGWDSHVLAVASPRHLSALLCPALFINLSLSTEHQVHFATRGAWNPSPEWQTPSSTLPDRLWLNVLNILGLLSSLAPLSGVRPILTLKCRVCWERMNSTHHPGAAVFPDTEA